MYMYGLETNPLYTDIHVPCECNHSRNVIKLLKGQLYDTPTVLCLYITFGSVVNGVVRFIAVTAWSLLLMVESK